jgi:maltose alpha-D-glucosyltransferase/alpha-amylase
MTRRTALADDPLWFKDAVIYEVRTRSFYDANGDGIGDLRGLAEKLDYLRDLGVTAIWLLPLCPSPGRDDGYDIADYVDVHPDVGTIEDFRAFVDEAHARGLRIITELVMNHTSDQHPWFQRARRAPAGSPERAFYVWSDSPERYREARVIFKDFEPSNWSWDPVAGAYFWHRFFSHQPDLNFENPAVRAAMLEVVDFWFGLGVDGLRLDAVPYLYEEDGTHCENLPQTHAFLKVLRAHVDARWKNRMLLAEANQWPEDAAAYFGQGDECHMNFHFPIMPRMFMAIHMEDRFPIMDILAQTPDLPPGCQWAMFLRNHDELTLEMVTDEERDFMYRAYAREQTMRINLGIRRRLAPLVGNDRRKMELLNGLLFALPGTPVLYYGDEIGMGDNVYLGDRNGVRTPMQWSADRNAGFSRANPQRLILPVIIDPEYHYEAINVDGQQNNPSSLLWWTKRLIAMRRRSRAFGRGTIEFLSPDNARVLAFVRAFEGETILVVTNLSRFVQHASLDLGKWKGKRLVEMFGLTPFPVVADAPYSITLSGHSFYWFALEDPPAHAADTRGLAYEPPNVELSAAASFATREDRAGIEDALPRFIRTRRWFRRPWSIIASVSVVEAVPLATPPDLTLVLVSVEYAEGEPETYTMPLAFVPKRESTAGAPPATSAVVATAHLADGREGYIIDALEHPESLKTLFAAVARRARVAGGAGELLCSMTDDDAGADPGEPRLIGERHTNAAIQYGDRYLLKVFRKLDEGRSPELELGRFLAARAPGLSPGVAGAVEYRSGRGEPSTLAVLQRFVPNEGTAWRHARAEAGRFYERVLSLHRDEPAPEPDSSLVARSSHDPPAVLTEVIGAYRDAAHLLGRRTAEMHLAFASSDEPAFSPEPYSSFDRRSLYQSLRNLVGRVLRTLRARIQELPASVVAVGRDVAAREHEILARFEPLLRQRIDAYRTRLHSDYHLEQVLYTGKDFVIIDFDGGSDRAMSERRRKRSPLRDVASMVRSFHYAAYLTLSDPTVVREADRAIARPWARVWYAWVAAAFLRGYRGRAAEEAGGAPFMPRTEEGLSMLLERFVLAKAFHELGDELLEPSERCAVPLDAIAHVLGPPPEMR